MKVELSMYVSSEKLVDMVLLGMVQWTSILRIYGLWWMVVNELELLDLRNDVETLFIDDMKLRLQPVVMGLYLINPSESHLLLLK